MPRPALWPMLALLGCEGAADPDVPDLTDDSPAPIDSRQPPDDSPTVDTGRLGAARDWCEGLAEPGYADVVGTWVAQDALNPPPADPVLVIGSSSIRRWERAGLDLADWPIVQRGFGGALLTDVAGHAGAIVLPYQPAAVLLFAGTNDIAAGHDPDQVLGDLRCLIQQLRASGSVAPVLFIGITPTPARWSSWDLASQVNAAVAELAEGNGRLVYVDVPTAFLRTGQPPSSALFVDDGLHLNEAGYALWTAVVRPALEAARPPTRAWPGNPSHPAAGARVLVDLGPSNAEDGLRPESPDAFGQQWNTWHDLQGSAQVLPGESLGDLRTTEGAASGIDLVITGGFRANGLRNGGLTSPDAGRLGELAVAGATADYFYTDGPDSPGALALTGLDPARSYRLRLFASRDWGSEDRVTAYVVNGAERHTASLQVSGADIGSDGSYDGNDHAVVTLEGLRPDAWGQLFIDVGVERGTYAYLSLLELMVEG
ncbi:MAG: hypothetical protein H6739_12215 [Alphaproteobacteria bacterium]|nr:hypothetical protein [Alphaproteobacteria bacterium]